MKRRRKWRGKTSYAPKEPDWNVRKPSKKRSKDARWNREGSKSEKRLRNEPESTP